MVDLLVGIVAVFCIGTSIWAAFGHFQKQAFESRARLVSALTIGSGVIMLGLLIALPQPLFASLVGIVLMLVSEAVFWGAIVQTRGARLNPAFTLDRPADFVRTGPYRFVRHPFYTSYLVFWTGFAIATWTVWSIPLVIGFAVMYWRAAVEEEAKFAETAMAGAYADYVGRTGRFFPKLIGRG